VYATTLLTRSLVVIVVMDRYDMNDAAKNNPKPFEVRTSDDGRFGKPTRDFRLDVR
jgi:hypothetical protein